jgi:thiamine pyrophosphokinase
MKCIASLEQIEKVEGDEVPIFMISIRTTMLTLDVQEYELIILGGLSGRLDQTIHTMSCLHKLRKTRKRAFVVTDDSLGWVLDVVSCPNVYHNFIKIKSMKQGEHTIFVNHVTYGPTCGLLPVGVDSTVLSTKGLRWNLSTLRAFHFSVRALFTICVDNDESSFDGQMSTSNHLLPEEETVWIKTSRPIWWCMEIRSV